MTTAARRAGDRRWGPNRWSRGERGRAAARHDAGSRWPPAPRPSDTAAAVRRRSQSATASVARPERDPRPGHDPAASCEWDRRLGGPNRWRPDSRRQSRTRVAPATRATNDRPCRLAAPLADIRPDSRSIHNDGRRPSAARLRRRNYLAADQTGAPRAWEKCRETTHTASCYCQTREGLSCHHKHCLNNMFVTEAALRVFTITNNAG